MIVLYIEYYLFSDNNYESRIQKSSCNRKMFSILGLLAEAKDPLRISDIAKALNYNRSTVFNIAYTLTDLGILEKKGQNKFYFGTQLYVLNRVSPWI